MIERLFSTRLRYRNYAIGTALILSAYLIGGFFVVKRLFLNEPPPVSFSGWLLIIIGVAAFTVIHIASMKQLDRVKTPAQESRSS